MKKIDRNWKKRLVTRYSRRRYKTSKAIWTERTGVQQRGRLGRVCGNVMPKNVLEKGKIKMRKGKMPQERNA